MRPLHLLVTLLLLFSGQMATACECNVPFVITPQDYNDVAVIFTGQLIRQDFPKTAYRRLSYYKVQTWYKGVQRNDTVMIADSWSVASCGLGKLTDGDHYLVFADAWNDTVLSTGRCMRTLKVPADTAKGQNRYRADTAFLDQYVKTIQKNGVQQLYDGSGRLRAAGAYVNGLPHGAWKYYHEDGKLYMSGAYVNGKKDGTWATYQYGKPSSTYFDIYRDGIYTYQQVLYFDNVKDREYAPAGNGDKWVEKMYYDDGKLKFSATTDPPSPTGKKDGTWNGPFRQYDRQGRIEEEGAHYKGLETGTWKYYKNGRLVRTVTKPSKAAIDKLLNPLEK